MYGGTQDLGRFESGNVVRTPFIGDSARFHGQRIERSAGYWTFGLDAANIPVEKRAWVAGGEPPIQILSMRNRLGCDDAIYFDATARRDVFGNGEDVRRKRRHIGLAAIAAPLLAFRPGEPAGSGGR